MSLETVRLLSPEIVLIAAAVVIYVAGAFLETQRGWSCVAGTAVLLAAAALAFCVGSEPAAVTGGPLTADALAYYGRWLGLLFGGLLVLSTARPFSDGTPEYVGSLLLAVAGLMIVAGASELVLLFLGLELIAIPTYILLYLGRRDGASQEDGAAQEATAKYFFLGILASALLLYGFCFLYGTSGSTQLDQIRDALTDSDGSATVLIGLAPLALVLIFAGLGFKIAAVPFHFYAPDVYHGTTHGNAALLSVIPKAAGMVAMVRILVMAMPTLPELAPYGWRIALVLAVLTMTLGNVVALWQDNLRRLLAYSSIAHAGYMLIGLTVALAPAEVTGGWDGVGALLFYLCVYAVATIGTFAALDYLGQRDKQLDGVDELAGLGKTRPITAAAIGVFMFSLAGIPPLAGFWGKLNLFGSALSVTDPELRIWFILLAVIGAINAAIAAAYYLRIVSVMYFRTPLATPKSEGGVGPRCAVAVCVVLTLLIGVWPGPLWSESHKASPNAIGPTAIDPSVTYTKVATAQNAPDPSHGSTANHRH